MSADRDALREAVARTIYGSSAPEWDQAEPWDQDYCRDVAGAALAVPALAAALDAADALGRVLALHVPDDRNRPHPECVACRAECMYCEGDHDWPCATVRAAQTSAAEPGATT